MEKRSAPLLASAFLALFLAGCATTQVGSTGNTATRAEQNAAFAQASTLAAQRAGLKGQALSENTRQIQALLAELDNATLTRETTGLPVGDPLYPLAGNAMQERNLPLPRPFDRGSKWNFDANGRPPADRDGYRPPLKLAVLLPLSGPMATAAGPVRDGLLAGYYGETRRRPEIRFYDTASTPADATNAYARAAADGAEMVVGPLGREQVDAIFRQSALSVPVLALNRGESEVPDGAASFSLAPEAEGVSVADYLLKLERKRVLVIGGNDDNGRRSSDAFRKRFTEGGGTVADILTVGDAPADVSAPLIAAAAKNVDAIFLAVRGSTARALTPQLALAGLGGKTRVGTSLLIQGTGKPEEDSVLDGVIYPTEAWSASGVKGLPAQALVAANLPTARGGAARLFAFGYDAWLLSAHMQQLTEGTSADLRGATGTLTLDGFGTVLRAPAWATFSGGVPVPISSGG
jgi:outer membrane PBP1 activator LpoA protein